MWLICNARVLFMLKPVDDRDCYTLVGETYVHGCMNYELVDELEESTVRSNLYNKWKWAIEVACKGCYSGEERQEKMSLSVFILGIKSLGR